MASIDVSLSIVVMGIDKLAKASRLTLRPIIHSKCSFEPSVSLFSKPGVQFIGPRGFLLEDTAPFFKLPGSSNE